MPRNKPKRPPQRAYYDRSDMSTVQGRPAFSMRDEARHTAKSDRNWGRDDNLRSRPVIFVSSGMMEPVKLLSPKECDVQTPVLLETNQENSAVQEVEDPNSTAFRHTAMDDTASPGDSVGHTATAHDDIPASNVPKATTNASPSETQNPSPCFPNFTEPVDSDSSEEVILFRGRGRKRRPEKQLLQDSSTEESQRRCSRPLEREEMASNDEIGDAMADYIANLACSDEKDSVMQLSTAFMRRDLGGDVNLELDANDMDIEMDNGMRVDEPQSDQEDDTDEGQSDQEEDETDDPLADIHDEEMARVLSKRVLGLGGDGLMSSDSELDYIQSSNPVFQKKKKRKRKGKLDMEFNMDDSDIKEMMRKIWDNDRNRKKGKKAQREALRLQGLLGKNKSEDPLDLRAKYPAGISRMEVKEELRAFISGNGERLIFPPMDNHGRKTIHTAAHKLKLTSKSEGSGNTRHTVVYRTSRSTKRIISEIDALISWKGRFYFGRTDVPEKAVTFNANAIKNATSGYEGHRYRDGDVVSASAPQLGEDNKGRTILEKMGWSKGMALGAEHNKGILEPVAQVVKTSKAGLGK